MLLLFVRLRILLHAEVFVAKAARKSFLLGLKSTLRCELLLSRDSEVCVIVVLEDRKLVHLDLPLVKDHVLDHIANVVD